MIHISNSLFNAHIPNGNLTLADKCPLRGYVTLTGPGTEFLDETMSPFEYASIRTMGIDGLSVVRKEKSLKMAKELEFIVMKGDHYEITQQSIKLRVCGKDLRHVSTDLHLVLLLFQDNG